MDQDIFFDCPQCNHTIKVSLDLVGVEVRCPDCGNDFNVPSILDGLNPRLRSHSRPVPVASKPIMGAALDDLIQLEISMRSLLRQQTQQIKQLDFLEDNCNLFNKQLNMMEYPSGIEHHEIDPSENTVDEVLPALELKWGKWSLVCAVVTLIASATVGILLIYMY